MEEHKLHDTSFPFEGYRPTHVYKKSTGQKRRFVPLLVVILLIGIAIFGAMQFFSKEPTKSTVVPSSTPVPTEDIFPTDTPFPTPTGLVTPTQSLTPTIQPTSSPLDKATGLNRSDLSVAVQNGSGQVGGASKMADSLKSYGYHIVSIGNASSFTYEDVTITVKTSASKYLPPLKSDVSKQYTVASSSATLSASNSADAVVIIGK